MSSIIRPAVDIQKKRVEIENEIKQIYADFEETERNNHHQQHSIYRNILLVGATKCGKTTLINVLRDPRYIPKELSLRAELQKEATCERNICLSSSNVILNIVELPERMINMKCSLCEINLACHQLGIQDFHLICLCASFDTGINGLAQQSFEYLIDYLGEDAVRPNLCLIITRCESKDKAQQQKLRDEVVKDVDYKRISQNFGREIYFSGALNRDDWNRTNDALIDQFETICNYRKNLLRLIQSDVQPFHLSSLMSSNITTDSSQPGHVPKIRRLNSTQSTHVAQPVSRTTILSPLSSRDHDWEQIERSTSDTATALLPKDNIQTFFQSIRRRCAYVV